jgi:hypothetical protein
VWSCLRRQSRNVDIPDFDVAVAGELNLDLILYGLPSELVPERELIAERMMLTMGGSSAILAHNDFVHLQQARVNYPCANINGWRTARDRVFWMWRLSDVTCQTIPNDWLLQHLLT